MNRIKISLNDAKAITYDQLLDATKDNKFLRSILKDKVRALKEQYAKENGERFLEFVRLEQFLEWVRACEGVEK